MCKEAELLGGGVADGVEEGLLETVVDAIGNHLPVAFGAFKDTVDTPDIVAFIRSEASRSISVSI